MTINSKTALQIKRLQENLVDRDGIIRTLKAENQKLSRGTEAIKRVLNQAVKPVVVKKPTTKKRVVKKS